MNIYDIIMLYAIKNIFSFKGDENIIKYEKRPFKTVEEMDTVL